MPIVGEFRILENSLFEFLVLRTSEKNVNDSSAHLCRPMLTIRSQIEFIALNFYDDSYYSNCPKMKSS